MYWSLNVFMWKLSIGNLQTSPRANGRAAMHNLTLCSSEWAGFVDLVQSTVRQLDTFGSGLAGSFLGPIAWACRASASPMLFLSVVSTSALEGSRPVVMRLCTLCVRQRTQRLQQRLVAEHHTSRRTSIPSQRIQCNKSRVKTDEEIPSRFGPLHYEEDVPKLAAIA